jgi:hypothetical protein
MLRGLAVLAVLITIGASIIMVKSRVNVEVPAQPIAFSHKRHASDYQLPCLYCHMNARRSPVAGIPSVQFCMGCHTNVGQENEEVQKLANYWTHKRAIPWVKVYDVPDFVYFSHQRHVSAQVSCESCHGAVQTMDRIQKATPLHMQQCVTCHRERQASTDCVVCHK